jgi:tetratricopeptide (TPR) repeat protein
MPGDREAFADALRQADHHRWESQWQEAARHYDRALAEFPLEVAARSGFAFCLMQMQQWQSALVEYQRVLTQDATSVLALSKVAELERLLDRPEAAWQTYLRLGDVYAADQQGARAEAAWQKAADLRPDVPEAYERLARHFEGKRDHVGAVQAHLAAALSYAGRGESAQARRHVEEVVRLEPHQPQALALLERVAAAAQRQEGSPAPRPMLLEETSPPYLSTNGSSSDFLADTGRTGNSMAKKGTPPAQGGSRGGGNPGRGTPADQGGRKRMTAQQVASALRQAQTAQTEGHMEEAIDLCEQIISSGFDRPDARYFLGWLYQEQERWEEAIGQFQELLNDADYALSCFYALGQCYRAMGDLNMAAQHFDEAVDRVNLDALTLEESDQLIQLCHEAAEAHRALGELEQTETVYSALLGFLRSRGWQDQAAEVEQMMAEGAALAGGQQPQPEEPPTVTFGPRGGAGGARPSNAPGNGAPRFLQEEEPPTITYGGQAGRGMPGEAQSGRPAASANDDWLSAPAPQAGPPPLPAAPIPPPPAPPVFGAMPPNARPMPPQVPAAPAAPMSAQPPMFGAAPAAPTQVSGAMEALSALARPQSSGPLSSGNSGALAQLAASVPYPAVPTGAGVAGTPADPLRALLGEASAGSGALSGGLPGPAPTGIPPLQEPIRSRVMASVKDIEKYVAHGLLTAATEECLRVIELAPHYLDVHLILGEIYVKQGKTEQAITKYAILIDTYLVNGRVDDAIATYRRILHLEPNNLTYRVRLLNLLAAHGRNDELLRERMKAAESYLKLGYLDKAIQEYEQALQENPSQVPMRMNYALALMKAGRATQAVAEYQRVLQLDPRNVVALARLQMALATGVGANATPGMVAAGGGASNRAASLEMLGRVLKALRGDGQRYYELVAREYMQALEASPSNVDLRYSLGQIQQQSGHFAEALACYEQARAGSGMEPLCRYADARCHLDQSGREHALKAAQELEEAAEVVRRTPVDPAVWAAFPRSGQEEHLAPEIEISQLLAKAWEQAGFADRAQIVRQQIRQTLPGQGAVHRINPPTPPASAQAGAQAGSMSAPSASAGSGQAGTFQGGTLQGGTAQAGTMQELLQQVQAYRANRQTDKAIELLKKIMAQFPNDPVPPGMLGDLYITWGMLDEGLSALRTQVELYLRSGNTAEAAKVLQAIASIYWDMGNQEEALSALRQVVQMIPEDMLARTEIVRYCLQANRRDEATFHQSVIARTYFASDQTKEAVAALQQWIAIDKTNDEAYDLLGKTYYKVGEFEQAQRVYRNLAKLDPDNPIAFERMQQLQQEQRMRHP